MEQLYIKNVPPKLKNFFSSYDLKKCFTCGTCASGCPITGMPEMHNLNVMKVLRMLVLGLVEEVAASDFPWMCTGCGRCKYGCPMDIDIPSIMATMKRLRPRDRIPWNTIERGDRDSSFRPRLSDSLQDHIGDLGLELAEAECPGFPMGTTLVYDYLIRLIKFGNIQLDRSVHKGKVFTFHDACKHGRVLEGYFGKGYYDEPRWIINRCVEKFVEMYPNRVNTHCCGAGGALWSSGFEKQSAFLGRQKLNSIRNSKADVVVVGCSKCHYQLEKRLPGYYNDCRYEVKYIWDVVLDSVAN